MAFNFSSSYVPVLQVLDREGVYRVASEEEVVLAAQRMLGERLLGVQVMDSPKVVRSFLQVRLGGLEHEVFAVLMLDSQSRLIEYVELFRGTVTQTSVYPREVVKEALARNAAAVILVHNHPSGSVEPSRADEYLTKTLAEALKLVEVRVLDHLVVGCTEVLSFAERGLL